jgi:lysine 2,3-aminomutase
VEEYVFRDVGDEDPLAEESFSPVPGITHRYPDRVLMVISNSCAIYCRYCTRKRIMYEDAVPDVEIDRMVDYIARTPAVRDVVVSGGDPLTYGTKKLDGILGKLRAIPHLEIIRIGAACRSPSPSESTPSSARCSRGTIPCGSTCTSTTPRADLGGRRPRATGCSARGSRSTTRPCS